MPKANRFPPAAASRQKMCNKRAHVVVSGHLLGQAAALSVDTVTRTDTGGNTVRSRLQGAIVTANAPTQESALKSPVLSASESSGRRRLGLWLNPA